MYGGTSYATAIASGIIALMLEANPDLTWRDVQHIIVNTANWEGLEASTGDKLWVVTITSDTSALVCLMLEKWYTLLKIGKMYNRWY